MSKLVFIILVMITNQLICVIHCLTTIYLCERILKGNKKLITYKFKKGECLCDIAEKFNTTAYKICKINGITNIDFIEDGQILLIKEGEK